jgi:SAM-dependent methyltransferase
MKSETERYINDWFINLSINKIPSSFYVVRFAILEAINLLKPQIKGVVLDLACGVMPYKEYLMNHEITNYIGIDLKPSEYHNTVTPDLYWDGIKIPLEDSFCDFVIATEFLEHYFDIEHILLEIKRVLKDGGTFFFTVPAIWPIHESPYDYNRFTPFALNEHFKKAHFSSWDINPLGGYHYSLAITLALWNDNKISEKRRKFIWPFIKPFILRLINKDKKGTFENGNLYSGIYGFVKK